MQDDNGNKLGPGSTFEFEGTIDDVVNDIELEEDIVLGEGDYMIYVPPGQKATVMYSVAV